MIYLLQVQKPIIGNLSRYRQILAKRISLTLQGPSGSRKNNSQHLRHALKVNTRSNNHHLVQVPHQHNRKLVRHEQHASQRDVAWNDQYHSLDPSFYHRSKYFYTFNSLEFGDPKQHQLATGEALQRHDALRQQHLIQCHQQLLVRSPRQASMWSK